MKVLLINPPFVKFPGETKFTSPPLGLAYIASELEKRGHEVLILDSVVEGYDTQIRREDTTVLYGLPKTEILRRATDFSPELVGISCPFSNLHNVVLELCRDLKHRLPNATIVLGGTHATVLAEELVLDANVDFVVRGEGEIAVSNLIEHLEGKLSLEQVSGLVWERDGEVQSIPQEFISDIDKLSFPARRLLNMEGYKRIGFLQGVTKPGTSATTMITSRGCPALCVFCSIHSVWGRKFRAHSAEHVLEELQHLREEFGIKHIVFEDDNITFDRERARKIFQGMIERNYRFTWSAPNGVAVWCLDEDLLKLMFESGCSVLHLGIESGDPETLKNIIHKPLRLEKVVEIINLCRRIGIQTHAFFVIGLPGETMDAMMRSMKFAESLDVDRISVAIATPYPGTELYEICRTEGYIPEPLDMSKLMTRVGQITTPEFSPPDVEALASSTYLRFAIRHPLRTVKRFGERFLLDPKETSEFVIRRLASMRRRG